MIGLFRRSRAFRMLCYVALVPAWALIGLISIDTLGKYTATGDRVLVALIMLFALWAWWYGEDRDRRARERQERTAATGTTPDRP